VPGLSDDFEAGDDVAPPESPVDVSASVTEWRDPVLAAGASVPSDVAVLEVVGLDLAHGQWSPGVFAQPCGGSHVVTVGMSDDMLGHISPAKEVRQPFPRPGEAGVDDNIALGSLDDHRVEDVPGEQSANVDTVGDLAQLRRHGQSVARVTASGWYKLCTT
jgi:hypothetical protein